MNGHRIQTAAAAFETGPPYHVLRDYGITRDCGLRRIFTQSLTQKSPAARGTAYSCAGRLRMSGGHG
jgi:hypothetical protein